MNIEPKLQAIEKEFLDIEERMGDPATASDPRALQDLGKKRAQLEPVVEKYRAYRAAVASIAEARDLLKGGDPEIAELAREELNELEPRIENFEKELTILLLPKDPNDEKSVIVEIRAGVGGDEAALFAADLYRMYTRFCERQRWKIEVIDSSLIGLGGYKEVIFRIDSHGAYSMMKYESGGHRVQRVPVTEASGRIHTSSATVAVMPEVEDIEIEIRPEELKIDT